MKHEIAKQNLKDSVDVLNDLNCHWWLEAGTCLAAVREGEFIDHDVDVDLGLTDINKAQEIEDAMIDKGFEIYHRFGILDNGYEVSFKRDDVKVDFFFFYRNADSWWHSAWYKGKQIFFEFSPHLIDGFHITEFLGIEVNLPYIPEDYLIERYGDNWKEPDKDWHWAKDPKCINWERSEINKEDIN